MNENPPLQRLYDNLKKDNYDLPDYNTFKGDMQDKSKLQSLYKNISEEYDLPDYSTFQVDMIGSSADVVSQAKQENALQERPKVADALKMRSTFSQQMDKEAPAIPVQEEDPLAPLTASMLPNNTVNGAQILLSSGSEGFESGVDWVKKNQKLASDNLVVQKRTGEMDVEKIANMPLSINTQYDLSVIPFAQDKPYTKYGAELLAARPDQRELERLNSGLNESQQTDFLIRGIEYKNKRLQDDYSILTARGADNKFEGATDGFGKFMAEKIATGVQSQDVAIKTELSDKYRTLVEGGQMTPQQADAEMRKEYDQQFSIQKKNLEDGLRSDWDNQFAEYVNSAYNESDAKDITNYYAVNKQMKELGENYSKLVSDSPELQKQIEDQLVHDKAIERTPILDFLSTGKVNVGEALETFKARSLEVPRASAKAVVDNLVGLQQTTGMIALPALIPGVNVAWAANVVSEKLTGKELLTGKEYGILDEVNDKTANFVDSYLKDEYLKTYGKPLTYQKPDGSVGVNAYQMIPTTAKTMTDMFLLLGSAEMGGGALKAVGVAPKVAENAGLFAASFLQINDDFVRDGLEAGMSESQANYYGATQASIQSLMELMSPNKGIRTALSGETAKRMMAEQATKELTFNSVYKSAWEIIKKEIPKEVAQEISQDVSSGSINGFLNKTMNLKNKLQTTDERSLLETMMVTVATTGLMSGGAQTINSNAQRSSALAVSAENYETFKNQMDTYLNNGQINQVKYDKIIKEVEGAKAVIELMPNDLSIEKKSELLPVLEQKAELVDKFNKADEAFKSKIQQDLDKVNEVIQTSLKDTEYNTGEQVVDVVEEKPIPTIDENVQEKRQGEGLLTPETTPSESGGVRLLDQFKDVVQKNMARKPGMQKESGGEMGGEVGGEVGGGMQKEQGTEATDEKPLEGTVQTPEEISNQEVIDEIESDEPYVIEDMSEPRKPGELKSPEQLETEMVGMWSNINDELETIADSDLSTEEKLSNGRGLVNEFLKNNGETLRRLKIPLSPLVLKKLNNIKDVAGVKTWLSDLIETAKERQQQRIDEKTKTTGDYKKLKRASLLDRIGKLINPKSYIKTKNGVKLQSKLTVEAFNDIKGFEKYLNATPEQLEKATDDFYESVSDVEETTYEDQLESIALRIPKATEMNPADLENLYNDIKEVVISGGKGREALNKAKSEQLKSWIESLYKANDRRTEGQKNDEWKKNEKAVRENLTYDNEDQASIEAQARGLNGVHTDGKNWYPGQDKNEFDKFVSDTAKEATESSYQTAVEKEEQNVVRKLTMPLKNLKDYFITTGAAFRDLMSQVNQGVDRNSLRFVDKMVNRSVINEIDIKQQMADQINTFFKNIFGEQLGGKIANKLKVVAYNTFKINDYNTHIVVNEKIVPVLSDKKNKETGVREVKSGVRDLKLTKFEALNLYKLLQNPKTREQLAFQGINERIQKIINGIVEGDPKLMAFSEFLDNFFESWYQPMNEVYRQQNKIDLPKEEFYYTIFRDSFTGEDVAPVKLKDIKNRKTETNTGIIKARTGIKTSDIVKKMNPLDVLSNYIEGASHYISFADTTKNLARIFNDHNVRESIRKNNGKQTLDAIDLFIERFRRGSFERSLASGQLNKLRSWVALAALSFKPKQIITQGTGFVRFMDNPIEWTNGLAHAKPSDWADVWRTPVMKSRYGSSSNIGMNLLEPEIVKYGNALKNGMNIVKASSMYPIKAGDSGAIMFGAVPYYVATKRKLAKENPQWSEDQVKEEALNDTQEKIMELNPTGNIDDISIMQNSDLGKLLMLFMGDNIKMGNATLKAHRNIYRSFRQGGMKAVNPQDVRKVVAYRLLSTMFFAFAANAFRTDDDAVDDMLWSGLQGNIQSNVILGELIQNSIDLYRGKKWGQGFSVGAIQNIDKLTQSVAKMIDKASDDSKHYKVEDWVSLVSDMAKAAGVPISTLTQNKKAIEELVKNGKFDIGRFAGYTEYQLGNKKAKKKNSIVKGIKNLLDVDSDNIGDITAPEPGQTPEDFFKEYEESGVKFDEINNMEEKKD